MATLPTNPLIKRLVVRSTTTPKPKDKRSLVSKLWDQLNVFDNSRTYEQPAAQNQKSILAQATAPGEALAQGARRSVGGLISDTLGLWDLVTPGTGTSQLTKEANKRNEAVDAEVKKKGLSSGLYKAGQFGTDMGTFLLPGALISKASKGAKATTAMGKGLEGWKTATAADMADSLIPRAAKWAGRPGTVANVGINIAQASGYRAARGIDVSPGTVAMDVGTSYVIGGVLGSTGWAVKNYRQRVIQGAVDLAEKTVDAAQRGAGKFKQGVLALEADTAGKIQAGPAPKGKKPTITVRKLTPKDGKLYEGGIRYEANIESTPLGTLPVQISGSGKTKAEAIANLKEMMSSAPQVGGTPLAKDEVVLYHRTSKANADQILQDGKFVSKENTGEIFLSNKKAGQNIGYGDAVVPVRVKKSSIRLDDEFPSGEKHYAVKSSEASPYTPTPQVSKTPFQNETEIPQINRILKNEDVVGDGEKIGDYYRAEKGENWSVQNMSPDEYLRRANKAIGGHVAEVDLGKYKSGDVAKYAADMQKGDKFPMPWLNEVTGKQEGRTRALAAKQLGYKEIPVAVATAPQVSKTPTPAATAEITARARVGDTVAKTVTAEPEVAAARVKKGVDVIAEDMSSPTAATKAFPDRIDIKRMTAEYMVDLQGGRPNPPAEGVITDNVYEILSPKIKFKIDNSQPLTMNDYKSLKVATKKVGEQTMVTVQDKAGGWKEVPGDQLNLLTGQVEKKKFTTFQDVAEVLERQEGGGATLKPLSAGQMAMARREMEIAEMALTTLKNSPLARLMAALSKGKMTANNMRNLQDVINTRGRKNPAFGKFLQENTYDLIMEKAGWAYTAVKEARQPVFDAIRQYGRTNKADTEVLVKIINGEVDIGDDLAGYLNKNATNPKQVGAFVKSFRELSDSLYWLERQEQLMAGKKVTPYNPDYYFNTKKMINDTLGLKEALPRESLEDYRRVGSFFSPGKSRQKIMQEIERDPFKVFELRCRISQNLLASLVPSRNLGFLADMAKDIGDVWNIDTAQWSNWFEAINADITNTNHVENFLTQMQGRFAAGTVIGNASSTLMNLIQSTLMAGVHPIKAASALPRTFLAIAGALKEGHPTSLLSFDGVRSSYMTGAVSTIDLASFVPKGPFKKAGEAMANTFYATDLFTRRFLVDVLQQTELSRMNIRGEPNLAARQVAMHAADIAAETFLPSRVLGTLAPALRRTTLARAFNLFQTEVIAQAESIVQMTKRGGAFNQRGTAGSLNVVGNLAGIAAAGFLYNSGFQQLFPGRTPAPDPIRWFTRSLDAAKNNGNGNDFLTASMQFGNGVLAQLPFVGTYSSGNARSLISIPIAETGSKLWRDTKGIVTKGPSEQAFMRLARTVAPLIGRGMGPIVRTGEGIVDYSRGVKYKRDADNRSRTQFKIDQNAANLMRVILGGSYNTKQGQASLGGASARQIPSSFSGGQSKGTTPTYIKRLIVK